MENKTSESPRPAGTSGEKKGFRVNRSKAAMQQRRNSPFMKKTTWVPTDPESFDDSLGKAKSEVALEDDKPLITNVNKGDSEAKDTLVELDNQEPVDIEVSFLKLFILWLFFTPYNSNK